LDRESVGKARLIECDLLVFSRNTAIFRIGSAVATPCARSLGPVGQEE